MALNFEKAKGNQILERVVLKNVSEGNSKMVINLPIELIDVNPDNDKIFNMNDIDFLAEGIEEDGFQGAIEVYKKSDGRYEISSGHRRFLAAQKKEYKNIPFIVKENVSDVERTKNLIGSNMRNRKLNPMDYARCIKYYKDNILKPQEFKGDTRKETARFFGISESQVHKYEVLLRLIEPLQKKAENGTVSFSALSSLVKESKKIQEEVNIEFDKFIEQNGIDELTREKAQKIIVAIKDMHNKEKSENNLIKISDISKKDLNKNLSRNIDIQDKLLFQLNGVISILDKVLASNPEILNSEEILDKIIKFNDIVNRFV